MHRRHSLLVDHREHCSQLALRLADDPVWSVAFSHLDVGDYLIDERVLIERKTLPDLAESIKDGRLFRQALRLAAMIKQRSGGDSDLSDRNHPNLNKFTSRKPARVSGDSCSACALLIEGSAADLRDSKMAGASLRAALAFDHGG